MNMISYRGPGMAGGLSTALTQAWNKYAAQSDEWWHTSGPKIQISSPNPSGSRPVAEISPKVIEGHYRYCNEFLWPVMHDLNQYATYRDDDQRDFEIFNEVISTHVYRQNGDTMTCGYFVHDYQLALLPRNLKRSGSMKIAVFWHIPWPRKVARQHVPALKKLVKGLLSADAVGFHTREYANNFMSFIEQHVNEWQCDFQQSTLTHLPERTRNLTCVDGNFNPEHDLAPVRVRKAHKTSVIVAPLGIDSEYWQSLASAPQNNLWNSLLSNTPVILSVDRADYTKAVANRLQAIDCFFRRFPAWAEKVTFMQICGKTRAGIKPFDQYWQTCKQLAGSIESEWRTDTWQPLVWVEQSFSSAELALLYRLAAVMLVNPLRDGLNLTAKEYVASNVGEPGVLALSQGAGAWHELNDCSLLVDPKDPEQMSQCLNTALSMSHAERVLRMDLLKQRVRSNALKTWWYRFADIVDGAALLSLPVLPSTIPGLEMTGSR